MEYWIYWNGNYCRWYTSRNENAGQKGKTGSDPDDDDNDGDDNRVIMMIMMPSMVMIRKRLEIFGACSPEKVIRRRWILPHRTEASPRWGSWLFLNWSHRGLMTFSWTGHTLTCREKDVDRMPISWIMETNQNGENWLNKGFLAFKRYLHIMQLWAWTLLEKLAQSIFFSPGKSPLKYDP